MTTLAALRRSGSVTLGLHALKTGLALIATAPLVRSLPAAGANPRDAALALDELARYAEELARPAGLAALGLAAVVPFLSVFWLGSMREERASARSLAGHARTTYPAALVLAMLEYTLLLGIALAFARALEYGPRFLPVSPLAEDALFAAICTLAGCAVLVALTVYDLSCAALAVAALSPGAALAQARRVLGFRLVVQHALAIGAIAVVTVAGELVARGLTHASGWAVLPVQQLFAFAATLLRAAWLANALQKVELSQR